MPLDATDTFFKTISPFYKLLYLLSVIETCQVLSTAMSIIFSATNRNQQINK